MAIVQSAGRLSSINTSYRTEYVRQLDVGPSEMSTMAYDAIWRSQPNVRTVVSFLARNIASLALHTYRQVSATDRQRLRSGDHELATILKRPNPFTTQYRWIESVISDLAIYDNHVSVKMKSRDGSRLGLFRIPPYNITPEDGTWMAPRALRVQGNKDSVILQPAEVVHFRGYDVRGDSWGVAPLETLRQILAEEWEANRYRERFWQNAARYETVISRPVEAPEWKDASRARFRAEWESLYAGEAGSGKTAILEEGMTVERVSFSAQEAQYLEARKLTREEVAAAYHIPPPMVGILDKATYSNIVEQHKMLYQDTLGPWLAMIEQDLELQLFDDLQEATDDVYVEFNIQEKLKGSFEEQAKNLQTAVGGPWLTRNEARARMNLPAMEGGDEPIVPLNVTAGGQASPTDATNDANKTRVVAARKAQPRRWESEREQHEKLLERYFDRQRKSVVERVRSGRPLPDAFDVDRWDLELTEDLHALALATAKSIGGPVAERFGGDWTPAVANAWLMENSRIAAEEINGTTYTELKDALAGAKSWTKAEDDEEDESPPGLVEKVFGFILTARLFQIAQSRVTSVGNFASHDAAEKSGARFKQWVVTNPKSRHPQMNGQRVPLGENFSNGLRWPGDAQGSADETAGCQCILDLEA